MEQARTGLAWSPINSAVQTLSCGIPYKTNTFARSTVNFSAQKMGIDCTNKCRNHAFIAP